MPKKIKLILSITGIILLGFLRGYIFYNTNWIYKTLTVGRINQARSEFNFMLDWTVTEVVIFKWIMTFSFTILFLGLSLLIIHYAFGQRKHLKAMSLVYAGLIGISGVLFLIGYIFGFSFELYEVIHTIMMLAQSFVPVLIVWLVIKYIPSS
ncbi:hypothetical protein K6119_17675 [Paracrocinitomix mangrovi]|uniref:XrtX-associated membrane protein n=1 Tax=Paracrocinitomix mangrovi TaxID=2862509 RepID=UPI001C8DD30B|nr:hypothetical protein [Paracrocinitomix mangrovi]UKN01556.1 hypothetical protein K6119_17675 [Paracrocinitomix mangrovi]